VLISDGEGGNEETGRLVTEIARHNDVLVVFVFDPLEGDLPQAGRLVVSDGVRQLEIDSDRPALRAAFPEEFNRRRTSGKHFLLRGEFRCPPLPGADPRGDRRAGGRAPPRGGAKRCPFLPMPPAASPGCTTSCPPRRCRGGRRPRRGMRWPRSCPSC